MYSPFGPFSFSYSVSSTTSSSSVSTTTTTTQQQHEVTKKAQWSSAPVTSGQRLREQMARSFANPAAYPAATKPLACLGSAKDFDRVVAESDRLAEEAVALLVTSPTSRPIKKVCTPPVASKQLPNAEGLSDYQELLCDMMRERMKMYASGCESKTVVGEPAPPPSSASTAASNEPETRQRESVARSNSQHSRGSSSSFAKPKQQGNNAAKPSAGAAGKGGKRNRPLPIRSKNIDIDAFLKEARNRELYKNPADRVYGKSQPKKNDYAASNNNSSSINDSMSVASSNAAASSSSNSSQNKPGPRANFCNFCKSNGEEPKVYMSHPLKDSLGKNVCPILRNFTCPKCHESGDYAHTNKYCPLTQRKQKETKIRQFLNDRA